MSQQLPLALAPKKIKKSSDKDKHKKKVRKTNITRRPKRSTYSEHVRDHYSSWENTTTLISSGMWRLFLDNRRYDASGSFPNAVQQAEALAAAQSAAANDPDHELDQGEDQK